MTAGPLHPRILYDDDDALAGKMGSYLSDGVHAGESVLAIVGDRSGDVLRGALGAQADRVAFLDQGDVYTRTETALASYGRRGTDDAALGLKRPAAASHRRGPAARTRMRTAGSAR
jgi:hypothetical protein